MINYSGMTFDPKYDLGEIVFHRAASDKIKGIVIAFKLYADGGMAYEVNWGDRASSTNFESELTDTFLKEFSED